MQYSFLLANRGQDLDALGLSTIDSRGQWPIIASMIFLESYSNHCPYDFGGSCDVLRRYRHCWLALGSDAECRQQVLKTGRLGVAAQSLSANACSQEISVSCHLLVFGESAFSAEV